MPHLQDDCTDDAALARLHRSGVEFAVAMINEPRRARHVLNGGAQSVLTDDPLLLGKERPTLSLGN